MAPRNDFLNQAAPENYVAGLGRGATGFTTRSDLGPARSGPSEDQIKDALAKRAAQLGTNGTFGDAGKKEDDANDNDARFQDPENEDDEGLFAGGAYDREDDEADRIYQAVDERMERRRKQQREDRERAEQEEYERKNPKIQQQFADLKRPLATLTDEDWASIPEVGDLTGKNKRVKRDNQANRRFYAVPDSVIAGASAQGQYETSIDANGTQTNGAAANGESADGTQTNFADIGRANTSVLKVRLDQAAKGSATDKSNAGPAKPFDQTGYLTSLSKSTDFAGEAQVSDVKRVRVLLESVIKTNPKHAPGWIAAARLEHHAGKVVAARNMMAKACENCPKSEDAWLENIYLNEKHNAKIIVATALKHNDRSVRLWTEAMNLEDDVRSKKRVVRQALDHVPTSISLWKEAVNLEEDPADARLMLSKATDINPLAVELWLALARLETADEARKILNKARKAVPTSYEIWIAAARLQEQTGKASAVDNVMSHAIKALTKESAMLKRDEWIAEAEKAEAEGAPHVCNAIIRETVGIGLERDDEKKEVFLNDAQSSIFRKMYATARAIYSYALGVFPTSTRVWKAAVQLEQIHGTQEAYWKVLDRAVEASPQAEELWLQNVREKWSSGNLEAARETLKRAFSHNSSSENIWLAGVQMEADSGEVEKARGLLEPAREEAGTDRVWVKSVSFERAHGKPQDSLALVADGLQRYPKNAKLHMQKGQIYQFDHSPPLIPQAREAYLAGTRACRESAPLWLLAARLEEGQGNVVKARSLLERARMALPKDPHVWVESVRVERRSGNMTTAKNLMARARQAVPVAQSGPLWPEAIFHFEPRNQRRATLLKAVQDNDNIQELLLCVARILWSERNLSRAMAWFEKAIVREPKVGDVWAWYFKFLSQHGDAEKRQDVLKRCLLQEPTHGEVWTSVRKAPSNASKSTEEILRLVVERLEG